jgi:hypothetical protein
MSVILWSTEHNHSTQFHNIIGYKNIISQKLSILVKLYQYNIELEFKIRKIRLNGYICFKFDIFTYLKKFNVCKNWTLLIMKFSFTNFSLIIQISKFLRVVLLSSDHTLSNYIT